MLELEDGGAVLLADLKAGAKTGLFLDQRENQRAAATQAQGRDVLNCFSYTGLFGLRAALAGARERHRRGDQSRLQLPCAEQQWQRNGLTIPHETVTSNVFDHLRLLDGEKAPDGHGGLWTRPPSPRTAPAGTPPRVATTRSTASPCACLRPGGVLVTCSCSHHLNASEFRDIVHAAAP